MSPIPLKIFIKEMNTNSIFNWIKIQIKFLLIGFLVLMSLGFGLLVMLFGLIALPIIRWVAGFRQGDIPEVEINTKTTTGHSHTESNDGYVDVKYEIIEKDNHPS